MIEYAVANCRHVFHDCSLVDVGPQNSLGVHTSYSQLVKLPPKLRKKLLLYHYGDEPMPDAIADGFAGFAKACTPFEV